MTQEQIDAIIRAVENDYAAAFSSKNAAAMAALCTDDATALSEWGDVMQGAKEFELALGRAFARMPGTLTCEINPTHARLVADGVIVTHGAARKCVSGEEETLYYSRVLVRRGDRWQIAAVQVAPASAAPDPRA